MVGVLPWGEHRWAPPSQGLVRLEGVGLGLPKVLLSLGPLPDPFPGGCSLPRVGGPGQTLAAMLPRPTECFGVGMAGESCHVFVRPHHQGVVCRVYLGRGAVDAGQGGQFARELCHEHHHGRVRGETLGVELLPDRRRDLR